MRTAAAITALTCVLSSATAGNPGGTITLDAAGHQATLSDSARNLVLHLSYDGRCLIDQLQVMGREVVPVATGVCSAVKVNDRWSTTRGNIPTPSVTVLGNTLTVAGIQFGGPDLPTTEDWTFTVADDHILWQIRRAYLAAAALQDTYFPGFDFADVTTWTGGLLDTGGVVWTKYLDTPAATYSSHAGAVTFWNRRFGDSLQVSCTSPGGDVTSRFSHHPSNVLSASFWPSDLPHKTAHGLARFLSDRQDVWQPVTIAASPNAPAIQTVTCTLRAQPYSRVSDRGSFKGLNGETIRELLNTVGRYGVIDRGIIGSNGWRSGFACLHEQWFAQIGLAVDDPDYISNYTSALDDVRDHAIKPDGRVLSRWAYDAGDAMPGTYDPSTGYYETQWGYTLDSQPSYVIEVAEQFDLTGDRSWLLTHRDSCRAALEYLLRRDTDHNGLVEMINSSHTEEKGSDWIDVVWASYENALVNAELHEALNLWAGLEEFLGDPGRAARYRDAAAHLRVAFNKPTTEGGLWNPQKNWYIYWRERDNSVHGDNLVMPVNFAALAYGVCEDPARRAAILAQIESLMQREGLFHWPLCFFPYDPADVHARQKQFPSYENGDIFLGWAELGVRAYAASEPAIPVKYIRKVLDRYEHDGLSFQRYLRANQQGEGDDILANNAMAIVGLYRDIYGIRPRHDRLVLDPHLTTDLAGTRVKYQLRGRRYSIEPGAEVTRVIAERFAVAGPPPFGISDSADRLDFFPAVDLPARLSITALPDASIAVEINRWPVTVKTSCRWTERCSQGSTRTRHTISALQPLGRYVLTRDASRCPELVANDSGVIEFVLDGITDVPTRLELSPAGSDPK